MILCRLYNESPETLRFREFREVLQRLVRDSAEILQTKRERERESNNKVISEIDIAFCPLCRQAGILDAECFKLLGSVARIVLEKMDPASYFENTFHLLYLLANVHVVGLGWPQDIVFH